MGVFFADCLLEGLCLALFDKAYRAAAEARADHARGDAALRLPCGVRKGVGLFARHFIELGERVVRGVDELCKRLNIACFEGGRRLFDARAFIDDVLRSCKKGARQDVLCALERLRRDVGKAACLGELLLKEGERFVRFGAAFVVFARHERVRLVAVGDDELVIFKL